MSVAPRIPVSRILKPRSVAIIGATEDINKFGGRMMHNVVRHGYAGALLPINPTRPTVLGYQAYPNVAAAPGPIDLVLVSVPVAQLLRTIQECADAGVGACVIVTAQLGEFDAAGAEIQNQATAIATSCGMRLIGPNCMGLITATHALALSSTMTLQHIAALRRGPVGFVSQSGALMGALLMFGHDHGVGFSSLVSVGNQADLELSDFFEALIDDDETNTICLYIEAINSPRRFVELARRARARGKRVLAVKAGRTDAGAAMAQSHTASLAGSYEAFATICRETGILLLDEPEAMIMAAGVLSRSPRMGVGDFGVVCSSGGGGAVTADRMSATALPLAQWSDATRARLDEFFLRTHQNNPIDLGAHTGALGPHIFRSTIETIVDASEVAAFLYIMTPQPLMPQTADAVITVWRTQQKPVVLVLDTSRFADDIREQVLAAGMQYLSRMDDALRVLDLLMRERDGATAPVAAMRPVNAGPLPPALRSGYLTESEAKALLRAYGLTTTREIAVDSADQAAAAAEKIGYPVVAKGESRSIVHKSDAGLVKLSLPDAKAVRQAFAAIAKALRAAGDVAPPKVLIQEMVRGDAELILGARHDDAFGAQVLVGAGGIFVELLKDIQIASAPLSAETAHAMLRRLTVWPILDGIRGRSRLDVDAVADALVRLSWLAADLGPRLHDLEINPVIVRIAGQGAIAVDGRGTVKDR